MYDLRREHASRILYTYMMMKPNLLISSCNPILPLDSLSILEENDPYYPNWRLDAHVLP